MKVGWTVFLCGFALLVAASCVEPEREDLKARIDALFEQSAAAYSSEEYEAALAPMQEAQARARTVLGADHPDTLEALTRLAHLHVVLGNFDTAVELYRRELEVHRRVFGDSDHRTLLSLHNLGTSWLALGKLETARYRLGEVFDAAPKGGRLMKTTLNNLVYLEIGARRFQEAEALIERAERLLSPHGQAPDSGSIALVAVVPGARDGGFGIDCSMFGDTGPFNPDPETGGDLAQCGPFGTLPIFGMWGDWSDAGVGGTGPPPAGGDAGPGPGASGTDADEGLSDEDRELFPDGVIEDFNGCARIDSARDRDRCCRSVREDCIPLCEEKERRKRIEDGWDEEDAELVFSPECTMACEKAGKLCRKGKQS